MEGIVKKPQYKIMHVIFNQCIRLNFSKALFTVFLFTIIETLLSMIPLSVAMNSASAPENAATAGSSSVLSVLFSFVLTLALCIVLFMMLYGMFCVTARMVQKQKVTVGWLFIALIKKDKKVLGASAIFTLYYTVLGFLAAYLFSYLTDKNIIPAGLGSGSLSSVMYFFAFAALVFVLAFIPFSFVHLILYYFKNAKVLGSFALSVRILWGQTLHFLGFVFYAAGTSLISLALLSVVLFLIPQNLGTSLGIFTMFLSILRLFEYYKVLSRILIAIPVYFFFTIGAIKLCRPEQASTAECEESEETGASLNGEASSADVDDADGESANGKGTSPNEDNASLNEDSADLNSENPAGETSAQGKK